MCQRSFTVYRGLLVEASPVFAAMFAHSTKESTSGVIAIDDIDFDTIMELLRFIYTGSYPNETEFWAMARLFVAADKYQVIELKNWCELVLSLQISVENVQDAIVLAQAHCSRYLLKAALTFSRKMRQI
jgi:speckle-type POZ protein